MLNKGTLDNLINSACSGDEVDLDKLSLLLSKISDKLFEVGEVQYDGFEKLTIDRPILVEARGVEYPFARVDANGIIHLGQPSITGVGFIALDDPGTGNPVGSKAMDGVIWVQKGTASLVWYSNGGRYFVAGTAF